jgi:peptidoglycan/xylan/chitin deacetylase (PgdA/CDA1 family)
MLDTYIYQIKLVFSFLAVGIIAALVSGVLLLRHSETVTGHALRRSFEFLRYRVEFTLADRLKARSTAALMQAPALPVRYRSQTETAGSVPVLVYHGILDGPEETSLTASPGVLKDHLFTLAHEGYQTISLDTFEKFLRGEASIPEKTVVLTFDDGRVDSFEYSDAILKAVGFNAIMFAISKYSLDSPGNYYLSENALQRMEVSGRWDIQAHTHNGHDLYPLDASGALGHYYSNKLWLSDEGRLETEEEFEARIAEDFAILETKLEKAFKKEVRGFAFPFGDFGQYDGDHGIPSEVVIDHAAARFPLLFYQYSPGHRFTQNFPDNPDNSHFLIRRIIVDTNWSGEELLQVLENGRAKQLPYKDRFTDDLGWVAAWGEWRIEDGNYGQGLYLAAAPGQRGAAAVIDGSRDWKDYEVRAEIRVPLENNAFLWMRFQDDNHNAACNFGDEFVHAEQTINGVKRVIAGVRDVSLAIPPGTFTIGARVHGRTIECLLNDEVLVASEFLDETLDTGGVGLKTWDADGRESKLVLTSVDVTLLE